jgi:hypothetical protein
MASHDPGQEPRRWSGPIEKLGEDAAPAREQAAAAGVRAGRIRCRQLDRPSRVAADGRVLYFSANGSGSLAGGAMRNTLSTIEIST